MSDQNLSKLIVSFTIGILPLMSYASDKVKILMIGDSITQGGNKTEEYTYRYSLFKLLIEQSICFDFIGTQKYGLRKDFKWPNYKGLKFDHEHQGYYGIKTSELLIQLQNEFSLIEAPDITLLHIGTNDRKTQNPRKDFQLPLWQIIDLLLQKNPKMQIYISSLNQRYDPKIKILRSIITNTVFHYQKKGDMVFFVNHSINWKERPKKPDSNTIDWVHPNVTGQDKMAKAWYEVMARNYGFKHGCTQF